MGDLKRAFRMIAQDLLLVEKADFWGTEWYGRGEERGEQLPSQKCPKNAKNAESGEESDWTTCEHIVQPSSAPNLDVRVSIQFTNKYVSAEFARVPSWKSAPNSPNLWDLDISVIFEGGYFNSIVYT